MTTTVEAIYENGMLKLPAPVPPPEKAHVTGPGEFPNR
jgi:predicted DNA-binding antitoxin AbrB/MazE fold protein